MKKYILLYISLALSTFLSACADEIDNNNQQPNYIPNYCGKYICADNQYCFNGECRDVVKPDTSDLCMETHDFCLDNSTMVNCIQGRKLNLITCGEGMECKEGKCTVKPYIPDDNPKGSCTTTESICLDSHFLSICELGSDPAYIDCTKNLKNGYCKDGKCLSSESGIGETCTDDTMCYPFGYCDKKKTKVCIKYSQIGESCEKNNCSPELSCRNYICMQDAKIGDACQEGTYCVASKCHNNICVQTSRLYEQCSETIICPENSLCVDGFCTPTKGKCTSNKDCGGDSYCCQNDNCGSNLNICIPYPDNANDTRCMFGTAPGIFEASVQCYWTPSEYPQSSSVLNSVAVGKIHNAAGIKKPLLAFVTVDDTLKSNYILRIIHPETCEEVENIPISPSDCGNNITLADFDGDGYMEIVAADGNISVYKWDSNTNRHTANKFAQKMNITTYGVNFAAHDIDNDGKPEIIGSNGMVFHADGTALSGKYFPSGKYTVPVLGDFNNDGNVEFIATNTVYRWLPASNGWTQIALFDSATIESQPAYADFGTPGKDSAAFNYNRFDGNAEIVLTMENKLQIWSIFDASGNLLGQPQLIMEHYFENSQHWGYPPAIGDFNGDGKPEIGVASKANFGVYDPKCTNYQAGKCSKQYVVWEKTTQDKSGIAGASAFDFDGDGKIEIVYGDEGYTRVYDGLTGEVLFSSYRNSATVIEYPIIADVDDDGSTEIVISSDNYTWGAKEDTSHRGIKCKTDLDCYSNSCSGGLCRCTNDAQCNWQTINGKTFVQYSCLNPLGGDEQGGKVCRAVQGKTMPGITVLRDRLDRWVSSRTIWNQHTYNITNINDDGTVPKTSQWKQNFLDPSLNNYRQQVQGYTGTNVAPDITGRFTSAADACRGQGNNISLTAQVCNRGTKAVGSRMPAVFYKGSINPNNILCVSYTDEMVPVKGCRNVSCSISKSIAESLKDQKIILLVNDDGKGGKTTVECNEDNNVDEITMTGGCTIDIN